MARRRRALQNSVIAWMCIGYIRLARRLPLSWVKGFTRTLGKVSYYLVPRIRKVGLKNLDLAYGDALSPAKKVRMLKAAVENVAILAAEFPRTPDLANGKLTHLFTVEGLENLEPGKLPFFISAHLGNWEWIAPAMSTKGFRVVEVVRELPHPALNREVDALRAANPNMQTLPKQDAVQHVQRLIREGWVVGILADQSPRKNAVPVTFFGHRCWASAAPALIADRMQANVHPMAITRAPDGHYTIRFYPPLDMVHSGNFRADLLENSQRCQNALEDLVRAHPEQWLWFHRRWKARPALEAKWKHRK